jgi:hypothetical protein
VHGLTPIFLTKDVHHPQPAHSHTVLPTFLDGYFQVEQIDISRDLVISTRKHLHGLNWQVSTCQSRAQERKPLFGKFKIHSKAP